MNGKPVKLDAGRRLDAACRRVPGLGVFICIALAENWYDRGEYVILVAFVLVTLSTVVLEFAPKK